MPTNNESLIEKAQASYRQLAAAATNLNTASDDLGKIVAQFDSVLQKLNLGIPSWVFVCSDQSDGPNYNSYQVGYDKVGGKWGIALRRVWGNDYASEIEGSEEWTFNEAPRWLRIDAIDKVLDLIEALAKKATETTTQLGNKLPRAKELATALTAAAKQSAPKQ